MYRYGISALLGQRGHVLYDYCNAKNPSHDISSRPSGEDGATRERLHSIEPGISRDTEQDGFSLFLDSIGADRLSDHQRL